MTEIIIVILVPLIGFLYHRYRKHKAYYEIIWKKSSWLKPRELLKERPFNKYYYQRPEDNLIREGLNNKKNVLIMGRPLSGKSRAAYQALTNLNKPHNVIIPRCTDINLETFVFPKCLSFWRPRTILIDDLHRFVEQQNFEHLFRIAIENNVTIVATCRSGMEHKKVKNKMLDRNIDLETIFGRNTIELGRVSEDVGKEIANKVGVIWGDVIFDETVGSIFMRLAEMEKRFIQCNDIEKTILRVIRNLYICGIYEANQIFPLNWIKILAKNCGLEGKDFHWTSWLDNLKDKEFITLEKDKVRAEEIYLEYIIKPQGEMLNLDLFEEMIGTFSGVPDALFRLGNRAYEIGTIRLEKAAYMKIAIKSFEEALKVRTLERFPMQYAITQINLGNAYRTLAEVEDKAENCKRAIKAHEESLIVFTLERFPKYYAANQNDLGNAYGILAEVEDRAENCKRAIKVFEEALKVYTLKRSPRGYAITHNNLGNAYRTLAEVEDKAENCKKAIKAHEESLIVFTLERSPRDYAATQNNLGIVYQTLAEEEDRIENCKKAIEFFEKAFKVRTLEHFQRDYAATQNSLGNTYRLLAEVEDKAENCKKAIKSHEESLKIRTLEHFPMDYAATQNNLGNAYRTLAEVEHKAENCKKAIKSFGGALKVYILERFPIQYAYTQSNLGIAYIRLAEVEDKAGNCKKAIKAFEEALKVFTKQESPQTYQSMKRNLKKALDFCEGE